jgi:hypothetical protein
MSRGEGRDRCILNVDWKLERKTSVGRTRFKWEDNIKINLKDRGLRIWSGFDLLRTGSSGMLLCRR